MLRKLVNLKAFQYVFHLNHFICLFCLCVWVCICVSRVFEVAAGPGGGEDLQDQTDAGEDQKRLGRCQETGLLLCVFVCVCVCL